MYIGLQETRVKGAGRSRCRSTLQTVNIAEVKSINKLGIIYIYTKWHYQTRTEDVGHHDGGGINHLGFNPRPSTQFTN